MQDNVRIEILKEGVLNIKGSLLKGLDAKSKFIAGQWNKELSASIITRINNEEAHIRNCIGYIQAVEDLITALSEELDQSRNLTASFRRMTEFIEKEADDYREKFFNATLEINELRRRDTK